LIRKLKIDICWTILRFFGYANNLEIHQHLWDDNTIPNLEQTRCFDLKKSAVEFLLSLYRAESSQFGRFDQESLLRVLKTTPFEAPWQLNMVTEYD